MAIETTEAVPRWIVAIIDDDEDIHAAIRLSVGRAAFFGRRIEFRTATSARDGESIVSEQERDRFVLAFVDVVMEYDTAGLDLVGKLRARFGTPLQLVLNTGQPHIMGSEEVAQRYEISAYLAKPDATPERLRTLISVGIRNFRLFSAMRVVCDSLSEFVTLFETITDIPTLDRLFERALMQYSAVWEFDYAYSADLAKNDPSQEGSTPWHAGALQQLRTIDLDTAVPGEFYTLASPDPRPLWGSVVVPLGGTFIAGIALSMTEKPASVLFRELKVLLRSWAMTRESLELRMRVAHEEKMRDQMQRERRESIAQMVAGVAHEVNTPLGVANAAAATMEQIMADDKFKKLQDVPEYTEDMKDIGESVTLIRRNISRADNLIRSFRKLSVGQLVDKREDLDIADVVEDVIKLFSAKARRVGVQLCPHLELHRDHKRWVGYAGFFSQVLLNLMENALRYAYPDGGGKVDITLTSVPERDRPRFTLTVADYGAGIPKENLPVIFEAFFTTGRDKGGTGLGLAMVQNIVTTVFDGTIRCESQMGQGTSFIVEFSHCREMKAVDRRAEEEKKGSQEADKIAALHTFVELEAKLARGVPLTSEEQLQFLDVKNIVEDFLSGYGQRADRRRSLRVPVHRPDVLLLLADGGSKRTNLQFISTTGATHASRDRIDSGTQLQIRYSAEPAVEVHAEVVSCQETQSTESGEPSWRVGLKFVEPDPDVVRNLRLWLAQLMLEHSGMGAGAVGPAGPAGPVGPAAGSGGQ